MAPDGRHRRFGAAMAPDKNAKTNPLNAVNIRILVFRAGLGRAASMGDGRPSRTVGQPGDYTNEPTDGAADAIELSQKQTH